jgi:hypothetical protein
MGPPDPLTGLPLDPSLLHLLEKAEEKHIGWLRIEIVNDKFSSVQEGKQTANLESEFNAVAGALGAGPCYFLLRANPDRWLCLVFLPAGKDPSPKNRLYAASAPALQFSVSSEKARIVGEYFFDCVARCKYDTFVASQKSGRILTDAEELRMDVGPYHSDPMPLYDIADAKVDENVSKSLEGFQAGSITTVFLSLHPDTLAFVVNHSGAGSLDSLAAKLLNKTTPAFILHKVTDAKTSGVPRDVFLHYVPKLAPPKLKVAYATYKAILMHHLLTPALPFMLEVWKIRHVSNAAILEEMYPKPVPPPPPIQKPLRRGKGRARLVGRTKFKDDGVRIHTPHNSPVRKPK